MFHDVPAGRRPAFKRLVRGLADSGRLISPARAELLLAGTPEADGKPPPVLLTFDDGFASNLEVAETILAPLGITAVFFVCPSLIDLPAGRQAELVATNIMRGRRPAPEPLMTWPALERLATLGHIVGSHTASHLCLSSLSADQQAAEIGSAAETLKARLGSAPTWFAYPFGDVDGIDATALGRVKARHRYCRSGVRGINPPGTHPLALRADSLDLGMSASWQHLVAEGGLDPLYRKQRHQLDGMAVSV